MLCAKNPNEAVMHQFSTCREKELDEYGKALELYHIAKQDYQQKIEEMRKMEISMQKIQKDTQEKQRRMQEYKCHYNVMEQRMTEAQQELQMKMLDNHQMELERRKKISESFNPMIESMNNLKESVSHIESQIEASSKQLQNLVESFHIEFDKIEANILNKKVCSVCLGIMSDIISLQCGHVFCKTCSHALKRCPACRVTITQRFRVFI